LITQERLKELFTYHAEDGSFVRNVTIAPNAQKGSWAGYVGKNGYRYISIDNKKYLAHRLAWLYTYGEMPEVNIDHIDGNGLNNKISNLRECNQSQNAANSKPRGGEAGLKGVTIQAGKFRARIKVAGKSKHLGYFSTAEQAHQAYCEAAKQEFGEFAISSNILN